MQTPPKPAQKNKILTKHKDRRIDPYFWMRERDSASVIEHLNAENRYTESVLATTKSEQNVLFEEMKARMKPDESSAPYRNGDYFYYTRYETGREYPISCRKRGTLEAPEEILLDVNELAKGHKYFDVGRVAVSYDQNWLLYAVDKVGRRFYDVHFRNLRTGEFLNDVIPNTTANVVWLNDNKTLLFGQQDAETLRSDKIYRYEIGSGQEPRLVFHERDEKFSIYVSKSLTHDEVYLQSESSTTSEFQFASAFDSNPKFKIFEKRKEGHEYEVIDGETEWLIHSNDKARNFRLFKLAKTDKPQRKNWREVIAHRKDVLIEDALVLKDWLILEERKNGLTQISYAPRTKLKKLTTLKFPDPTYVTALGVNAEYDADTFRYDYESPNRPESVFDFDLLKKKSALVKQYEVPTYDADLYTSRRVWCKGKGGVRVPISLVFRKDKFKKGKNPLFVYGYGSYGISNDPIFRRTIVSLLDRGFVYAITHIRGGSEMGRHWYDNGKMRHKKNTFSDFIDSTEYLLKNGWGQRGHVYAMGGSAGGLLMGAVVNMRPDLYRGIIAAVPFVDVVTTMLDASIPLTTGEYEEWGNPNKATDYKYIKSYSPYDNVKRQAYPSILVLTGYHDSQVQYWEPAKWVAKLRDHTTSNNPIIFKIEMSAGHSGVTGRYEALKDSALEFAFVLMLESQTAGGHKNGSERETATETDLHSSRFNGDVCSQESRHQQRPRKVDGHKRRMDSTALRH